MFDGTLESIQNLKSVDSIAILSRKSNATLAVSSGA